MSAEISLSANHLRSVSVTMYLIEKSIIETEELLLNKSKGVCFEVINDLQEYEVQMMLEKISGLKKLINNLATKYQLKKNTSFTSRILQAKYSRMWEILGDTFSKRLKGFGELPDDVASELDSDLNQMMEIIEQLLHFKK
ncbi:MAG: hypothetical protein JW731_13925 [Bacteroidales bacterium]|nr:hypothetical protein [Bacteroidales bacterium]